MTINLQSVHFDADKKLISFAEEKVNKLKLFYEGIVGAEIILKLDKSDDKQNKISEVKLLVSGDELFAKKQCSTFEESIDDCVSALKTQVLKYKEKHNNK